MKSSPTRQPSTTKPSSAAPTNKAPTSSTSSASAKTSSISSGAIAGIVIAILFVVALGGFCWYRTRNQNILKNKSTALSTFEGGDDNDNDDI